MLFYNLVKAKKLENENILIHQKKCKDLAIFFYWICPKRGDKNVKSALS